MQQFKVKFIYEEILKENQFNEYKGINALNLMWQQAYHDVNGKGFIKWGQETLYLHYKPEINEKFKDDYKGIGFAMDTLEHEFKSIGYKGREPYQQDGYTYEVIVTITSVNYTCIGILPDKTYICVDAANEIKYISGAKTKAIYQSPTL